MFSKFFIDRPIFATVISIVIVLAGIVSIKGLAVEEYPQVVPPQVMVLTSYPGASAETASNTVASVLEQEINGVDDMIYISSTAAASGEVMVTVFFETGTDPDQATINVNNRVQAAMARLPKEVQDQGVTVRKRSTTILEILAFYGDPERYDSTFITNYALVNVVDDLKRIDGVGDVVVFGAEEYAMRIWIKPDRLAKLGLVPMDVAMAIREQSAQYAPGQFGQEPIASGTSMFTYTISAPGRLVDPEEFGDIILRANKDGSYLRLKDVATIELGAQSYAFSGTLNKKPAVPVGIFLQSGANALDTADAVRERLERSSKDFPDGLSYEIPYDTTKFVRVSINEVIKTFVEAMLLVTLVVFVFLQNFRATIIPMIAVPVSIIGTFAGLYLLGYTINLLTLFALILAIGIVVDDAIIVIENVERILRSKAVSVKEATVEAMSEVTSPIIAIVLVLAAVFIPVALMGGFTGEMYKQFAVTIVVAVSISGLVALTLTPALCAVYLPQHMKEPIWPLRKFNQLFDWVTRSYTAGVKRAIRFGLISVILYAGMIFVTADLFNRVPKALVPMEDKGTLIVISNLPAGASLDRTKAVRDYISDVTMANPNVERATGFAGFDVVSTALKTSAGTAFVNLKDWSERTRPDQKSDALAGQFMGQFMRNPDAMIFALNPPPIMGLSVSGGFEMHIQDRTGSGVLELAKNVDAVVAKANQRPELGMVRGTINVNVPQYKVTVDREKAKSLGIMINDLFATMQGTFGTMYINDFNLYGRSYRVMMQADGGYRKGPENLKDVFVRTARGDMVSLDALVTMERVIGPDVVERFNLFQSVKVMGEPKPGFSSGDAIRAIEEVTAEVLPEGYTIAWSGSSYQEKEMSGTGTQAFIFGVIMIYLILAALYERWLIPFAVVLAVPFAVFGAVGSIWLRGLSNELYFQIGLVVLIGLSAKNAILIIEFAMINRENGMGIVEAVVEAAKTRFRPIVMTSFAFTLGVLPLAISQGAGEASRHAIGTGVIGGMLTATLLAIYFIPLFYVAMAKTSEWISSKRKGLKHA